MSSVLSLAASYIVASSERVLLSVGRDTDESAGAARFAPRPARAAQTVERAAPPANDSFVVIIDRVNDQAPVAATRALPDAVAAAAVAATSAAPPTSAAAAAVDAAAAGVLPLLAAETIVAPSQAAYAYAQMMQVWLETKGPRQITARAPKAKARERR